ncbi:MAG: hypothetical protein GY755_06595 [Chloroflexi bacterium]|nr:hypothetical protein [Chloroflexota bacterium]
MNRETIAISSALVYPKRHAVDAAMKKLPPYSTAAQIFIFKISHSED